MSVRHIGVAVLATVAVALAGCGGNTEPGANAGGEPISVRELAASGSTSASAKSGRFSFDLSATLPGGDDEFVLSGGGAFDTASERASFAVDLSSFARLLGTLFAGLAGDKATDVPDFDDPSGWKIEIVQDGDVEYVRLPALHARLPEGKTWVRGAEGSSGDEFDFGELERVAETDPRQLLETLATVAGEIETVGIEELRGVETTHYRAAVDPLALAKAGDREGRRAPPSLVDQLTERVGDVPIDIWLDADGLVRKFAMEFSAEDPSTSESNEASMTFELWDYDEPVAIELPPASEVVDASVLRG